MTLIATIGIPGAGKTSLTNAMREIHPSIHTFIEPPEAEWPIAAHSRELCGHFTAATAMRNVRVPQLYQAQQISEQGGFAVVDAYYDKLMYRFLDSPGLEWFMPKSDPHYAAIQLMAKTDYEILPDADAVIGLKIDMGLWQKFISQRGRNLDKSPNFISSFAMQGGFLKAAKKYCSEQEIPYVEIAQEDATPKDTAIKVIQSLEENGIHL